MKKGLLVGTQKLGLWEKFWAEALEQNDFEISFIALDQRWNKGFNKLLGILASQAPKFAGSYFRELRNKRLNKKLIAEVKNEKPDYFFVYNDSKLSTGSIDQIKKIVKKIIVILGDNPFFFIEGHTNILYLIENADIVITADKHALKNLELFNNTKSLFVPAGTNSKYFYPLRPTKNHLVKYGCDILFVGTAYGLGSFGYHRSRILSELADFSLKIFGDWRWKLFFKYFPNLKSNVVFERPNQEELNIAHNCAKIYVITANPWAVDAIPARAFDAISSGVFVIAEYCPVYETLFPNNIVPTYKSLKELREKVEYYLKNDIERIEKAKAARRLVIEKYQVKHNVEYLIKDF